MIVVEPRRGSVARISATRLPRQRDACEEDCRWAEQRASTSLQTQRSYEQIEHGQRMTLCTIEPDPIVRQACRDDENARYAMVVAGLDARQAAIEAERARCEQACAAAAHECERLQSLAEALERRKLKDELLGSPKPGIDPIDPRSGAR